MFFPMIKSHVLYHTLNAEVLCRLIGVLSLHNL